MRILLVNKFIFPKGGAETYTFDVGKMLEEHGHEVQYFGLENEKNIVGNAVYSQVANGLSLMQVIVPVGIVQGIVNIPLSLFFLLKMNMGVVGVLLGTVLSFMVSAIAVPIAVNKEICIHMRDKS